MSVAVSRRSAGTGTALSTAAERLASPDGRRTLRLATAPRPSVPIHLAALGPRAVRLAGELSDGWTPFLLPLSGLDASTALLREGATHAGRAMPRVCPGLPVAVAPDPVAARALASWWVTHYLTNMGPLYADALRRAGFDAAVDAVLASPAAHVLLDELTVHGDADTARVALDRWYAAGADEPVIVLPPGRAQVELDHMLESLAPR